MSATNSRALERSAHWCFQKLRDCRDPDLAAELRFLATSLLRRARATLAEARAARRRLAAKIAA